MIIDKLYWQNRNNYKLFLESHQIRTFSAVLQPCETASPAEGEIDGPKIENIKKIIIYLYNYLYAIYLYNYLHMLTLIMRIMLASLVTSRRDKWEGHHPDLEVPYNLTSDLRLYFSTYITASQCVTVLARARARCSWSTLRHAWVLKRNNLYTLLTSANYLTLYNGGSVISIPQRFDFCYC